MASRVAYAQQYQLPKPRAVVNMSIRFDAPPLAGWNELCDAGSTYVNCLTAIESQVWQLLNANIAPPGRFASLTLTRPQASDQTVVRVRELSSRRRSLPAPWREYSAGIRPTRHTRSGRKLLLTRMPRAVGIPTSIPL